MTTNGLLQLCGQEGLPTCPLLRAHEALQPEVGRAQRPAVAEAVNVMKPRLAPPPLRGLPAQHCCFENQLMGVTLQLRWRSDICRHAAVAEAVDVMVSRLAPPALDGLPVQHCSLGTGYRGAIPTMLVSHCSKASAELLLKLCMS